MVVNMVHSGKKVNAFDTINHSSKGLILAAVTNDSILLFSWGWKQSTFHFEKRLSNLPNVGSLLMTPNSILLASDKVYEWDLTHFDLDGNGLR